MSDLLIIGHRGAPAAAPENTLQSFLLAAQTGAQMVELDVHLSKDGKVVVIHDETLNRTTSGTGPVMARTLASLKRLDAGTAFSPQFAGTKIPVPCSSRQQNCASSGGLLPLAGLPPG